jgi:NAD-dependent deacetylase
MPVEQTHIDAATGLIQGIERLAVLTGAGISKESGVPTFRDAMDGLWAQYDPQQLATPAAFRRSPRLVWDWYTYRRELLAQAAPNAAHHALVELEALVPEVVIITQNVDGFHRAAGSSDVIELHGNLSRNKCFDGCKGEPTHVALADALPPRSDDEPPRCPHCGAFIRPDVVWFTEALPEAALARAMQVSRSAQVMLVVGTSGVVQPAASMPYWALKAGAKLINVNPGADHIGPSADVFLQGPAGEMLPRLVAALCKLRG